MSRNVKLGFQLKNDQGNGTLWEEEATADVSSAGESSEQMTKGCNTRHLSYCFELRRSSTDQQLKWRRSVLQHVPTQTTQFSLLLDTQEIKWCSHCGINDRVGNITSALQTSVSNKLPWLEAISVKT